MDDLEQLCECHVIKSTLSIGIGIEVLGFWPVLVLVLVLKISFNQELVLVLVLTLGPLGVLVLVLTSGLSEVLVLVLVWPNWYCLCLVTTLVANKEFSLRHCLWLMPFFKEIMPSKIQCFWKTKADCFF